MLSDDLKLVASGDKEAIDRIVREYRPLVSKVARKYFLIGASPEDLHQEGMIGLFKAITSFKEDNTASFKTYAFICIKRQILDAIRVANNNKNLPLNAYFSINNQGMIVVGVSGDDIDEEGDEKGIYIPSEWPTPEEAAINAENIREINEKIERLLSGLEKQVISLYAEGYNYIEIAKKLKKEPKSIDNALSRIKMKLRSV